MKSMMALLVVLSFASTSHAQFAPTVTAGSMAEYAAMRNSQHHDNEEQYSWDSAKKLTVFAIPGRTPKDSSECLRINEGMNSGTVGSLECYDFKVMQILDKQSMMIAVDYFKIAPLILQDYPTKDLVDGDRVRLVGLIRAEGTQSYLNVQRMKKTTRVIRFLTREECERFEADQRYFHARTWKARKGEFEVIALFVEFADGKVVLEKTDGTIVQVDPNQLSDADGRWYREEIKRRNFKN